ncbi:unnamed protein product [marine sediment metagenome]|uniref:Uncharacterized protein n=1 Tax=marine sediment metagenome TaxID=412755 RepID=X1AVJ1_9ZZZZ
MVVNIMDKIGIVRWNRTPGFLQGKCYKCKKEIGHIISYYINIENKNKFILCPNCFQLEKLNLYKNYKVEYYG